MGKIFTNAPPFYQQLRAIAIPVAVQNLITVGVSMLDTLMLGSMGEVQLSASSLANQWFFMLTVINFGLAGGANVLVAQYWGKGGDPQGALHCLPDQRLHFAALLPGSPLLSRDHHVHLHQ